MNEYDSSFIARSRGALLDPVLQSALKNARSGFVDKRQTAVNNLKNFEELREKAREVRSRNLEHLYIALDMFQRQVVQAGGHIHWATSPQELQKIVVEIAKKSGARTATKGKSMVGEEADLNEALSAAGIEPKETDLGEYIIQLAEEPPSHIVAPALHKTRKQISSLFKEAHRLPDRELDSVKQIVDEARQVIRRHFLEADIGITGANILIAESGTAVLCTNEGNGDLTASLPRTHIITTSIDKVVASWNDAGAILRVLARSATGQTTTTYTSFYHPRQVADLDGPENFHIVLLDNGRSALLKSEFQEMLQCIKCGACMNHCPVYQAVGGHSYGSVYPGPMGSVLTPLLRGQKDDFGLADASTFCGRCAEVCPVKIPLPDLLRSLRDQGAQRYGKNLSGWLGKAYMSLAKYPGIYRRLSDVALFILKKFGRGKSLPPLPGFGNWQQTKEFPSPKESSFQHQWAKNRERIDGR